MTKLITSLFLFFPIVAFCQTREKALTNAEQFSLQSGTLIERQFIKIGRLKSMEVTVLKLKDLNSNLTKSALRFELTISGYTSDTKIVSLDMDEIDDLMKAIANLQSSVFPTKRDVYTEVAFKSKTGFEAGAYYDTGKEKWISYLQLDSRDSMLFLSTDDFETLLNLVSQAKQKM